jgi:hypothetical protein
MMSAEPVGSVLVWIDKQRLILLGLGVSFAATALLLEVAGQYGPISKTLTALLPITLAIVVLVLAQFAARLAWGLLAGLPLVLSALLDLLVSPTSHPLMTVLTLATAIVFFVFGLRLHVFSPGR